MRKFFAFDRIQSVFWQIQEGGFWKFWDENVRILSQLEIASEIGNRERNGNMLGWILESKKWRNMGTVAIWQESPCAIRISTILGLLKVYMIVIIFSMVVMAVELVFFKWKFIVFTTWCKVCRYIKRKHLNVTILYTYGILLHYNFFKYSRNHHKVILLRN